MTYRQGWSAPNLQDCLNVRPQSLRAATPRWTATIDRTARCVMGQHRAVLAHQKLVTVTTMPLRISSVEQDSSADVDYESTHKFQPMSPGMPVVASFKYSYTTLFGVQQALEPGVQLDVPRSVHIGSLTVDLASTGIWRGVWPAGVNICVRSCTKASTTAFGSGS